MKKTVLAAALLLSACAGHMQGLAHGPNGAEPATLAWDGGDGAISATIGTETFTGTLTDDTRQSRRATVKVTSEGAEPTLSSTTTTTTAGRYRAILVSQSGHSMTCEFLNMMIGECQVSDGRTVKLAADSAATGTAKSQVVPP